MGGGADGRGSRNSFSGNREKIALLNRNRGEEAKTRNKGHALRTSFFSGRRWSGGGIGAVAGSLVRASREDFDVNVRKEGARGSLRLTKKKKFTMSGSYAGPVGRNPGEGGLANSPSAQSLSENAI